MSAARALHGRMMMNELEGLTVSVRRACSLVSDLTGADLKPKMLIRALESLEGQPHDLEDRLHATFVPYLIRIVRPVEDTDIAAIRKAARPNRSDEFEDLVYVASLVLNEMSIDDDTTALMAAEHACALKAAFSMPPGSLEVDEPMIACLRRWQEQGWPMDPATLDLVESASRELISRMAAREEAQERKRSR